jgi:hypothetical protein
MDSEAEAEERTKRRLAVHRWLLWGGWLGYLPFGVLVFRLVREDLALPFLGVYMVSWAANGALMARVRCPRCGNQMFVRGWYSNILSLKCLHCRWPKAVKDGG